MNRIRLSVAVLGVFACYCGGGTVLGAGQPALIQGVDVQELLNVAQVRSTTNSLDVNRWGLAFSVLGPNNQSMGTIRIGVFRNHEKADEMLRDQVLLTPAGPERDVSGQIGEQGVAWKGRILFRRSNVLVDLHLPETEVGKRAEAIDAVLVAGRLGVRKGGTVDVPNLVEVDFVNDTPRARATTGLSGHTAIVDRYGQKCQDNEAKEVCFATEGCVLAEPIKCDQSYLSAKRKAAKIKEKKEKELSPETRPQQVEEAMSTLRDKGASPYHRNKAVVALGNSGDGSTVPILLAELEKASYPVVKQNTIAALGRLHDKQAIPALLKMLDAPVTGNVSDEGEWEAIFRRQAANALGYIGDSSALATLKKATNASSEYQSVRDAAKSAIRKIEESRGRTVNYDSAEKVPFQ